MNPIVVLGIAGFTGPGFGRLVVRTGLHDKHMFIGLDLNLGTAPVTGCFTYSVGNASDAPRLRGFLRSTDPECIVNLTGIYPTMTLEQMFRIDVGISETILDACADGAIGPTEILLISSATEYGLPTTNPVSEDAPSLPITRYWLTKSYQSLLAAYLWRVTGAPVVIARSFNLTGDGAPVESAVGRVRRIVRDARNGDVIRVGNLESRRAYIALDLAVELYWKLPTRGVPEETHNVCSGRSTGTCELLERLIAESGKRLNAISDPALVRANDVPEIFGSDEKVCPLLGTECPPTIG